MVKGRQSCMETIFVGSGFVAKYPEGGGNFSVVLQYLLGLRRRGYRAIWLETLASTGNPAADARKIAAFQRRIAACGLGENMCLLVHEPGETTPEPGACRVLGMTRRALKDLLRGPTTLLNLSYTIRPPLLNIFDRRILCSLDPTEVGFWMQSMEMGQSHHQEFATIGVNTYGRDSRVPRTPVRWKTYFLLVDTTFLQPAPRPKEDCFSTIGQWYWDGCVQWEGEWRDFSKQAAFAKFMDLPRRVPEARWTLAMNLNADDSEIGRIQDAGWEFRHPHGLTRTPREYYRFIRGATAEFSAVKLESFARSGWLSDRSAVYLALGRPVITESTGAEPYLPDQPGIAFVQSADEAAEVALDILAHWQDWSRRARATAMECLDAAKNIERILA